MTVRFDFFPGGRRKALTMSYDDGQIFDRRLVEIFNAYGIRGTFHLNSERLGEEHFIAPDEVKTLYAGHEVSVHSATHPFLEQVPDAELLHELLSDRERLEALCGYPVRGMSYPFGTHTAHIRQLLPYLGLEYSRTVTSTHRYTLPEDFLQWHPTCHHDDQLLERLEKFSNPWTCCLFYVWGHSFEFDRKGNWSMMEEFCKKASGDPDCWYATNIEIVDYYNAQKALRFSADRHIVTNPSAIAVVLGVDGKPAEIPAGSTVAL